MRLVTGRLLVQWGRERVTVYGIISYKTSHVPVH